MSPRLRRAVLVLSPWFFVQGWLIARAFGRRRSVRLRTLHLVAYGAGLVTVALVAPLLLVPIAAVVLAATAAGLRAGRHAAGVAEGIPAGHMPLVNLAALTDRDHFLKRARRDGPVFKAVSPTMPVPTACVVGLPRAVALLRDHDADLAPVMHPFDPLIPGRLLRHMRGDAHRHYRRILRDTVDDDVLERCRPAVEAIVARGLGRLCTESAHRRRGIDPHATLERAVVVPVLVRLFFGLDPDTALGDRVATLLCSLQQDVRGTSEAAWMRTTEAATLELDAIVRHLAGDPVRVATAPAPAGNDHRTEPACFLGALLRTHPDALDDPTVLRNLVFTARTGSVDLTGLLHWTIERLGRHPQWLRALRDAADPAELADRVVMETLRMEQSELLYRFTTAPIDVEGATIPAGWLLRVCVRESHRDPAVFTDPERFDPDRFTRSYSRTEYSPLGTLAHTCLGSGIVRVVTGTFVRQLGHDHELTVVSDDRPVFDVHWRPGRRHRIALRPLGPA